MTDSRELLGGFLDWFREVAARKLGGLTLAQTTEVAMPSGTTMLGILKHLAWDERRWFPHYFLGGPAEPVDVTASFRITPSDTIESVLAQYRTEADESRRIVAATASLDTAAVLPHDVFGIVTLEWILVHMIEETARHCGHLDILRELTDGKAGD